MKKLHTLLTVTILACALLAITSCTETNANIHSSGAGLLRPADLRCEYLVNPLGIDEVKPRLSWITESNQRGQKQSAYRLLVAGSRDKLKKNIGDLWDTGKVQSDRSIHIAYNGKPLQSRMQCFWKVMAWDEDGKPSTWSKPAFWSMGLLHPEDWKAKWIGTPQQVREEVREHMEKLRPGSRYILSTNHSVMDDIPPENFRAMLDAGLEFGVY